MTETREATDSGHGADRVPFVRLSRLAASPAGLVVLGMWGFAEAIAFFIIPDVGLSILALVAPRRAVPLFVAAVVGALAGTAVLYAWAMASPAVVESVLLAIPGIGPPMIAAAHEQVSDGSPLSITQFGAGTPLKVYTYAWATGPQTAPTMLVAALVNRLTRIGPGVAVAAAVGHLAPGLLRRHDRLVLLLYAIGYIVGYVLYFRSL